jgi:hypothetical protein
MHFIFDRKPKTVDAVCLLLYRPCHQCRSLICPSAATPSAAAVAHGISENETRKKFNPSTRDRIIAQRPRRTIMSIPWRDATKLRKLKTRQERRAYLVEEEYLVTALVPSDTACLASSPGRISRTDVWISRDEMVDFLLYAASLLASVATRSKMSLTNEFRIDMARLEMPVSGCTCLRTECDALVYVRDGL